jgi:hypothetical protein
MSGSKQAIFAIFFAVFRLAADYPIFGRATVDRLNDFAFSDCRSFIRQRS